METLWNIAGRIIFSRHRDMFAAQLGTVLLLVKLGVPPGSFAGKLLGGIFRGVIGVFLDEGILAIDLTIDSIREGSKLADFEKHAKEEYDKAMQKNLPEAEKQKIRERYLKTIQQLAFIGTGN